MDPLQNVLAFIASIVGTLAVLVIALTKNRREDGIRAEERDLAEVRLTEEREASRQALADERAHTAMIRAEDDLRADRLREADRREADAVRLRESGVGEAKELLRLLGKLEQSFRSQKGGEHGSHHVDANLRSDINLQSRMVPHRQLGNLVRSTLRVINEVWVVESVGDLDDQSGFAVQFKLLNEILDVVTDYIANITPGLTPDLDSIAAVQKQIDETYDEYHR